MDRHWVVHSFRSLSPQLPCLDTGQYGRLPGLKERDHHESQSVRAQVPIRSSDNADSFRPTLQINGKDVESLIDLAVGLDEIRIVNCEYVVD